MRRAPAARARRGAPRERGAARSRARSARRCRPRWGGRSATTCCASSSSTIRRELGESRGRGDRDRERCASASRPPACPRTRRRRRVRELERLAQTPAAAAEHSVIRTYLEWMADLPWSSASEDVLSIEQARRVLDEDHYGLEKVKDRIVEYIAVLSLKRDLQRPDPVLRGPARHRQDLARALDRARARARVRAHLARRRARRGGDPRPPPHLRRRAARAHHPEPAPRGHAEPRRSCSTRSTRSAPTAAAIRPRRCSRCSTPSRTATFSDHYLEVPFDLSQVLFIATANVIDPVPPALRDRMEVIELPGYTEEDKLEIARALSCCRASSRRTVVGGVGPRDPRRDAARR